VVSHELPGFEQAILIDLESPPELPITGGVLGARAVIDQEADEFAFPVAETVLVCEFEVARPCVLIG